MTVVSNDKNFRMIGIIANDLLNLLNSLLHIHDFLMTCIGGLLKMLREKEKMLVFSPVKDRNLHCMWFLFYRLQMLSNWLCLNFALVEIKLLSK